MQLRHLVKDSNALLENKKAIVPSSAPVSPFREIDLIPDDWGPKSYSSIADVALTRRGPDEVDFEVDSHFLLILLSPQTRRDTRTASSRMLSFAAPAGSVEVLPSGVSHYCRWDVPKENILMSVDPTRLLQFAAREFDVGRIEMRPIQPGVVDRTAARIGALLRNELASASPPSRFYLESLSTALLFHMLRTHASVADATASDAVRGGLSPRMWRNVQGHIRESLSADLSLPELASRAGLSYSHFLRAFRQTSGVSPHRYIMLMRANQAREMAASSRIPLKQIAILCGFAGQSHMTTVMKSLLGITPGEVRRQARGSADPAE